MSPQRTCILSSLLVLLALSVRTSLAAPVPLAPTYAGLALAAGPILFADTLALNASLNATTAPNDPYLSAFRKSLIAARDVLDIFVFAYPTPANDKHGKNASLDLWARVRNDINFGYTAIGDYQDLNNIIDPEESVVEAMRNTCITWRDAFLANVEQYNYSSLFTSADISGAIYTRPQSELSLKYWGNCNQKPSSALSGIENIAVLFSCMIDELSAQLPVVQALTQMYVLDQVTVLHDYKKQLRALRTLSNWYPSLWNVTTLQQQTYQNYTAGNISLVYNGFGLVHGLAVQPLYYATYGPLLDFRASALAAQTAFRALNTQLTTVCWAEQLALAQALIISTEAAPVPKRAKH